jgi:acetate kinase
MKILVLNSGSSSLKYQLFLMPDNEVLCSGLVERIGAKNAIVHYKSEQKTIKKEGSIKNHKEGLQQVVELILDPTHGSIKTTEEINAVGHRVVHGGNSFTKTTIIDASVKKKIKELFSLAPLHNPPNFEGIMVAETLFEKAVQVAVFDTAFHQSIPEKAYKYAIPNTFEQKHHIRLYGFHGTSHKYVIAQALAYLHHPKDSKIISLHLGNGCSMTAVQNGKSIDHSLGFGPSTGLIMGTRSGDIDHGLIFHLVNNLGYPLKDVQRILDKESGMFGLTGLSDMRDIQQKAQQGDANCQLALEMNAYRIKKYIGAYTASMNGLDTLIFTAGIGENSSLLRQMVCEEMNYFGISISKVKNHRKDNGLREIQSEDSKVKILIIPTNEEQEIAHQTYALLNP